MDITKELLIKYYITDNLSILEVADIFKVSDYFIKKHLAEFNIVKSPEAKKICRKESLKRTKIKKYGSLEAAYKHMNDTLRKTCEEKYGSFEEAQRQRMIKYKKACLEKYGVENAFQAEECKEKMKKTWFKKYGVEHASQSEEVKNKAKETCIEKYGADNYFKTDEFKMASKKTCLEKYGVENASQSPEVINKMKQTKLEKYGDAGYNNIDKIKSTCLEKYGNECYMASEDGKKAREKTVNEKYGSKDAYYDKIFDSYSKTCLEKYGVTNAGGLPETLEKIKNTNTTKYGVEYAPQAEEVKEHYRQTVLDKYGVDHYSKSAEYKDKYKKAIENKYGSIDNFHHHLLKKRCDDGIYPNEFLTKDAFLEYLKKFDNINDVIVKDITNDLNCSYNCVMHAIDKFDLKELFHVSRSHYEDEIIKILKDELCIKNIKRDDRVILGNGQEIDIYLPDYKLGIEFNGTYWHCAENKPKNYHIIKSKLADEAGIRLIHIWEYEWNDIKQQKLIKTLLELITNKVVNRIYARDCDIRVMSNKEAKPFNDANHLQGHRNAQVTYGLFYKNELVQLMSFSKTKYNKNLKGNNDWEIIRGCPGSNNLVVGGVSKLFKHFVKDYNPDSVFSYCDFNKFDGKSYENIGMKFVGYTGPDKHWLMKDGSVLKRNPKKYKELSESCDSILWGCGSKKYLWKKENE